MLQKEYSFKFSTSWDEIKSFDPYKTQKTVAKNVAFGVAFIALEIAANLYVPMLPTPAFIPDNALLDVTIKAFKAVKSVGL
jgi:hypothetical protein